MSSISILGMICTMSLVVGSIALYGLGGPISSGMESAQKGIPYITQSIFQNKGICGDGTIQSANDSGKIEQCDNGPQNGIICTPQPGKTCTFCNELCETVLFQMSECER